MLVALVCLGSVPAGAIVAPAIVKHGECDEGSLWRLTVRSVDADTLRVRFAIAGGPVGDTWNVFLDHNGTGFFAGSRVSGVGGLVLVRRKTVDLDGLDRINAGALDTDTGETCSGHATHA